MADKTMITLNNDTLLWLDQQILEARYKHNQVIDRGIILRGMLTWAMRRGIWFNEVAVESDVARDIEKVINGK